LKHDEIGLVSMANAGRNTNGSQQLSHKKTVFGKVVSNMDVMSVIESCGSRSGEPTKVIRISDCGEVTTGPLLK
jgi:cyclophilin family peptidyl-prolyl cis-trans isomerase